MSKNAPNSVPLIELFQAGVKAVMGDAAVAASLQEQPLASNAPVYVLAVGKAAGAMMQGALNALPERPISALIVTKPGHASVPMQSMSWVRVIESSHPVPDELSLHAGAAATTYIQHIPDHAQLLVLLSGGASALMEQLIDGLTLTDLQALNEMLLAGGYPIGEMNRLRKTLSCIKGGKLCHYLPNIPVTQLVISDVPGDVLSDIGSGPLAAPMPSENLHPGEVLSAATPHSSMVLSPTIVASVNAFGVTPPQASHWVWGNIQTRIVGSSAIAQQAVLKAAKNLSLPNSHSDSYSIRCMDSLCGDVKVMAEKIAEALLTKDSASVQIWGGETHCVLPKNPGRGGRNQHLALLVAKHIAGVDHISVLCCGTDGSDGPTDDAGALVTGKTLAEGEALGMSVDDYLQRADSGSYLAAVGALVTTGPTGTNVMDLVIAR